MTDPKMTSDNTAPEIVLHAPAFIALMNMLAELGISLEDDNAYGSDLPTEDDIEALMEKMQSMSINSKGEVTLILDASSWSQLHACIRYSVTKAPEDWRENNSSALEYAEHIGGQMDELLAQSNK